MNWGQIVIALTKARRARGLSRRQVAKRAGVSRHALLVWETGLVSPSLHGFLDWADAVGKKVTVEDF